jgi:hypothetical protein
LGILSELFASYQSKVVHRPRFREKELQQFSRFRGWYSARVKGIQSCQHFWNLLSRVSAKDAELTLKRRISASSADSTDICSELKLETYWISWFCIPNFNFNSSISVLL